MVFTKLFSLSFNTLGTGLFLLDCSLTSKVGLVVREAFDRLIEGVKQVDADKVMSVYDKGPKLLIFNNNGTATSGWDNVEADRKSVV